MIDPVPQDPIGEVFLWRDWFSKLRASINSAATGAITSISVAVANGFGGSVTSTTTPIITITTSVTGLLKGNGTGVVAAVAGTDYVIPTTHSYQTPTTGFNITIANGVGILVLNPAGTLATGTIVMPSTPVDGQEITVSSSKIISSLTVSPNAGQTLLNAPVTLQLLATTPGAISGYGFKYIFITSITTWIRMY